MTLAAAALEGRGIGVFKATTHRGGRGGSNAGLASIVRGVIEREMGGVVVLTVVEAGDDACG